MLRRSLPSLALVLAIAAGPATARAEEHSVPQFTDRQHFTIDPVVDGLLVVGGATFDELLGLILATGELRPLPPGPSDKLLSIDRYAVTQTIDPNAGRNSNFGLWAAYGYALLDPILSGVRDGRRAFFVDAVLYAESATIASALTEMTKIAVRRPRPIDYRNCGADSTSAFCQDDTNLQLSFFSGHASATAALSGTATYLAFARSGWRSKRPWITLAAGTLLTAFVSYERVRSGDHFPTDVIVGSMVGGGVGVLVPHLHRRPHYHEHELEEPPVIIGYAPTPGGGSVTAQMRF
ncbi:MAG: phosphoesterase PA-phosphatase related protein [Myxococcales bacterium]|nr:phosphoesterase PA-phosphatase related protein [Myxococcales bacterium]